MKFDTVKPNDEAVLAELGSRLGSVRLARNLTQAELAKEAGVSKRTLERIEAGQSAQLTNFIRVLRSLDLLERLELLLPPAQPGPMDVLLRAGKPPQRASGRESSPQKPWTWADDD
jgi:transcriptional regulator with XRE-family HTH domain